MIRAVLFDFGQTLVDSSTGFRKAEKQAQRAIFEDLGLASWDDFLNQYRKVRKRFKSLSNFSRIAMWRNIYFLHERDCDEKILNEWEQNYWETVKCHTKLFPETISALEKLSDTYDLAVITNTEGQADNDEHRIAGFPRLQKFFSKIVIAGESGIPPKPDPIPFETCVKNLGLSKKQVVYVGDDWHIDIQGALNSGISPIWLKHHSVNRTWPLVTTSVPVITSLQELTDLTQISKDLC